MEETESLKDAKKLPWVKSPNGVFEVYANNLHLTWSIDDVRIRLAQVVDNPETPDPGSSFRGAAEERAAITMSWRLAAMLRNQLSNAIENYEKTNGPININAKLAPSTI
jgi:hypothetical protein